MSIVTGLPNTKKDLECVFVRNVAKIPAVLRSGKYASAADDYGAIGVWIDDAGHYRGEAMRWMRTVDSATFLTMKRLKVWYKKWLKKIGERPKAV